MTFFSAFTHGIQSNSDAVLFGTVQALKKKKVRGIPCALNHQLMFLSFAEVS
jgi:hypothetical protein